MPKINGGFTAPPLKLEHGWIITPTFFIAEISYLYPYADAGLVKQTHLVNCRKSSLYVMLAWISNPFRSTYIHFDTIFIH